MSKKKLTIEEELEGKLCLTQFGRALNELGVHIIYANSPRAKGRIKRAFRIFQDILTLLLKKLNYLQKHEYKIKFKINYKFHNMSNIYIFKK